METNGKHLAFIDGLRGVLAFYVLCVHFVGENTAGLGPVAGRFHFLFHFGHAAVGFFIVLSGYSLMLPVATSADHKLRGGWRGYLYRRARRILPPYYAALALSIAILILVIVVERPDVKTVRPGDLSFASVASHLLLVHTWTPGENLTINMALWSVATEWHIYFLFPGILLPVWRRCGAGVLIVVSFAAGIAPLLVLSHDNVLIAVCPWYLGLFATGMAGAVVTASPGKHLVQRPGILGLICVVSAVVCVLAKSATDRPGAGNVVAFLCLEDAATGFVALCLLIYGAQNASSGLREGAQSRGLVMQWLESRPAAVLGGFSYSLYATHCAVLTAFVCLNHQLHLSPTPALLVRVFVGIPAAVAAAWGFSLWFEAPFLKKRSLPPVPTSGVVRPVLIPR